MKHSRRRPKYQNKEIKSLMSKSLTDSSTNLQTKMATVYCADEKFQSLVKQMVHKKATKLHSLFIIECYVE